MKPNITLCITVMSIRGQAREGREGEGGERESEWL